MGRPGHDAVGQQKHEPHTGQHDQASAPDRDLREGGNADRRRCGRRGRSVGHGPRVSAVSRTPREWSRHPPPTGLGRPVVRRSRSGVCALFPQGRRSSEGGSGSPRASLRAGHAAVFSRARRRPGGGVPEGPVPPGTSITSVAPMSTFVRRRDIGRMHTPWSVVSSALRLRPHNPPRPPGRDRPKAWPAPTERPMCFEADRQ